MVINLKTAPKKVLTLTKLRTKRRNLKKRKPPLKVFASFSRKFLDKRLKKFKSDKDFTSLHVLW